MPKQRVAIVGGGISGLAAAWYLQKMAATTEIHLFESQARLGGCIETVAQDGQIVELGADNFQTTLPDAWELSRELGIDDELIQPAKEHRFAQVVRAGKVYPIPLGFSLMQPTQMWPILRSPVLSWSAKLRLAAEYFVPARKDSSDESLRDFVLRRLGKECYDRLVEPIVGGIFTADGTRLSMQAAMPQFVAMERQHGGLIRGYRASLRANAKATASAADHNNPPNAAPNAASLARRASGARYDQFVAPRLGMQSWIDRIVSKLNQIHFHQQSPIEKVTRHDLGWWLHMPNGAVERFDRLLIATPTHAAAKLLKGPCPKIAQLLGSIPYASSVMVAMVISREEVKDEHRCFGIVVPAVEQRSCLAISMSSEKYPGRVASGEMLLRLFMGGYASPELGLKSDEELSEMAWSEAKSLLGLQTKPSRVLVKRWQEAMPQYHVGHGELITSLWTELKAYPGLALAGNGYEGVGIPQCVRSAKRAISTFDA